MKPEEIAAVVRGMVPAVREFVEQEVGPIAQRVQDLESAQEHKSDKGESGALLAEFAKALCDVIAVDLKPLPVQ